MIRREYYHDDKEPSLSVCSRQVGSKKTKIVATDGGGGVSEEAIDPEHSAKLCLDEEESLALAVIAHRATAFEFEFFFSRSQGLFLRKIASLNFVMNLSFVLTHVFHAYLL